VFELIGMRCPECRSTALLKDEQMGEVVCTSCGLVVQEKVFVTRPRPLVGEEHLTKSTHGPPHRKMCDYTFMPRGYEISPRHRWKIRRMEKLQRRFVASDSGKYIGVVSQIRKIVSELSVPKYIQDDAFFFYQEFLSMGSKGVAEDVIIPAVVYLACRMRRNPRTLEEICRCSGVNKKLVGRAYRLIVYKLRLKVPPLSIEDLIERYRVTLKIPPSSIPFYRSLLREARKKGITSGKSPVGMAAAILYASCILAGHPLPQHHVAMGFNITEVTLRNRYKDLVKELGINMGREKRGKHK